MKANSNGTSVSEESEQVKSLYYSLIDCWNANDAQGFARLFTANGNTVGFDGSQLDGQDDIEKSLNQIFTSHEVAKYVTIIREVRSLSPGVAILRAVVGMVPPGSSDIKPERNAIQILVAEKQQGVYKISLFQNTPAAFDGRPEAREQLSTELREVMHSPK